MNTFKGIPYDSEGREPFSSASTGSYRPHLMLPYLPYEEPGMYVPHEVTDAKWPFDDKDADIIVRSRDCVDFRVFKVVLMLASPVFKDTFKVPQPPSPCKGEACVKREPDEDERDGLPVLRIAEKSRVFETLLRFCYPQVEDPDVDVIDDIIDVLEAALKYDLEIIAKRMKQLLLQPKFLEHDPIIVYAVACRLRLREHAELAAQWTLRTPMLQHSSKGLDLISGAEYHRLLLYHKQCAEQASFVMENENLLSRNYVWFTCQQSMCASVPAVYPKGLTIDSPRRWWVDFTKKLKQELSERPCGATALDVSIRRESLTIAAKCPTCKLQASENLAHFCRLLEFSIDNEIIDNVSLDLGF